eukprot:TRINITY_DN5664_c0_g2_i1.p2 TRINITY_DN5664_c0_g2~~TRINITY_DN5664_c0_g2_i1.p2  ORF type:complete len:356 (+),score=89.21 TRINITY_DN5664_c0_g2_i1:74-1069(+)
MPGFRPGDRVTTRDQTEFYRGKTAKVVHRKVWPGDAGDQVVYRLRWDDGTPETYVSEPNIRLVEEPRAGGAPQEQRPLQQQRSDDWVVVDPVPVQAAAPPGAAAAAGPAPAAADRRFTGRGVVTSSAGARVRQGESTESEAVGDLAQGTQVDVLEIRGKRAQIRSPHIRSPGVGWVSVASSGTVILSIQCTAGQELSVELPFTQRRGVLRSGDLAEVVYVHNSSYALVISSAVPVTFGGWVPLWDSSGRRTLLPAAPRTMFPREGVQMPHSLHDEFQAMEHAGSQQQVHAPHGHLRFSGAYQQQRPGRPASHPAHPPRHSGGYPRYEDPIL